jgi:sodium transport system permease protein
MIPQQVFNATLLGLLLGLLALRSGSVFPGIAFHLLYNGLELLRVRASSLPLRGPIVGWFASVTTTKQNELIISYTWPTLLISTLVTVWLIGRLVRSAPDRENEASQETPLVARMPAH